MEVVCVKCNKIKQIAKIDESACKECCGKIMSPFLKDILKVKCKNKTQGKKKGEELGL